MQLHAILNAFSLLNYKKAPLRVVTCILERVSITLDKFTISIGLDRKIDLYLNLKVIVRPITTPFGIVRELEK